MASPGTPKLLLINPLRRPPRKFVQNFDGRNSQIGDELIIVIWVFDTLGSFFGTPILNILCIIYESRVGRINFTSNGRNKQRGVPLFPLRRQIIHVQKVRFYCIPPKYVDANFIFAEWHDFLLLKTAILACRIE
jgi:hypothetical protein